ncbi:MAG TPA: cytochrome c3 family protein [Geobacteraceae bacterium]|jgi:hypothetical protein|nr:cytochrome c3 family protein [Geobacteraceae bacterium]
MPAIINRSGTGFILTAIPQFLLVNSMKVSWIIAGLVVAAGAVVACLALLYVLPLDRLDRSPVQPIAFSHKLHAGTNAIPCLFCHRSAPKSPIAGIPAVADCRACHQFISPNAPEIRKLMGYWDRREPIPWVRVYGVPDFVYFPHMMHIRANLPCAACHGEVAAMDRIVRSVSVKMGWCLDCHRQLKASIDCWTCHI